MTDDITTTLRGRVGNTPQLHTTRNGQKTVRLRLAVSHWRKTDTGLYEELATQWYTVKAWGMLAQNVAQSVTKGEPVIVHGRVSVHGWLDSTNQVQTEVVLNAYSIGHDLRYGWSQFGGRNVSVSGQEMSGKLPSTNDASMRIVGGENTENISGEAAFPEEGSEIIAPEGTGSEEFQPSMVGFSDSSEDSGRGKVMANAISGGSLAEEPPF